MMIAVILIGIFTLFSFLRLILGPTIWDRLLCANLITSKFLMILILLAYIEGQTYFVDFAIVYALLGFIGLMFVAISIQKRGKLL